MRLAGTRWLYVVDPELETPTREVHFDVAVCGDLDSVAGHERDLRCNPRADDRVQRRVALLEDEVGRAGPVRLRVADLALDPQILEVVGRLHVLREAPD